MATAEILVTNGMDRVPVPDGQKPLAPRLMSTSDYVRMFPDDKKAVPLICQDRDTVCVINNFGGNLNGFMSAGEEYKNKGHKLVILGSCESACTLLARKMPRENVCMGPHAQLGFHGAKMTAWSEPTWDQDDHQIVEVYANIKDTKIWASKLPTLQRRAMERHIPFVKAEHPPERLTEQQWDEFLKMRYIRNSPFRKYYQPCPVNEAYNAAEPKEAKPPMEQSAAGLKKNQLNPRPTYRNIPEDLDGGVIWGSFDTSASR